MRVICSLYKVQIERLGRTRVFHNYYPSPLDSQVILLHPCHPSNFSTNGRHKHSSNMNEEIVFVLWPSKSAGNGTKTWQTEASQCKGCCCVRAIVHGKVSLASRTPNNHPLQLNTENLLQLYQDRCDNCARRSSQCEYDLVPK